MELPDLSLSLPDASSVSAPAVADPRDTDGALGRFWTWPLAPRARLPQDPVAAARTQPAYRSRVGLRNLGNTCYMASAVQSLACFPEIVECLTDLTRESSDFGASPEQAHLVKSFTELLVLLRDSPDGVPIWPRSLRLAVCTMFEAFRNLDQHDSQEFLRALISAMTDATTPGSSDEDGEPPPYPSDTAPPSVALGSLSSQTVLVGGGCDTDCANEAPESKSRTRSSRWFWRRLRRALPRCRRRINSNVFPDLLGKMRDRQDAPAAAQYWSAHRARNKSVLTDLFYGLLKSEIRCTDCGRTSRQFEPFVDLSLPVAKKYTLRDCFAAFVAAEPVDYHCEGCGDDVRAKKRLTVARWPRILVIQMKRFERLTASYCRKLQPKIKFPLEGLDLTEFGAGTAALYDLKAVNNHIGGTVQSGHFTTTGMVTEGTWAVFDDDRVHYIPADKVVSRSAYVLFYRLRSTS